MNLHVKPRTLYFARAGKSEDRSYKSDAPLSLPEGTEYAKKLAQTVLRRRTVLREEAIKSGLEPEDRSLAVWVSPRQRTVASAHYLEKAGCVVRWRPQLSAQNPGLCDNMSWQEIKEKWPEEVKLHEENPFLHRFPRAESYHDVAIRLEPVILEIERFDCGPLFSCDCADCPRERNDLIIIAHESVLRVLYGYFLGIESAKIPNLKMPRETIFEVSP